MPVFYPENVERGDRLQQLVDDIVHYQTQITNSKNQMDKADARMRPALNQMLKDNHLTTFDDLVNKIANELPADQKQKYLDMIAFNRKFGDVTDSIMQVSSWILGGAVTTGIIIDITIFSKTVGMMRVVKAYANCFKLLVTEGFEVAYAAFKGLRAGLAIVAEGFTEASTFGKVLGTAAKFCEFLGWAGVIVDGIMLIMQLVEGAEQKTKLIDAIHETMVTRLSCAYFNDQATTITAHNESFADYLDMASSSDPDDQAGARALGKRIAKTIAADQQTLDLSAEQTLLEQADNQRSHYSSDDLSHADVVARATADVKKQDTTAPVSSAPPTAQAPNNAPPSNQNAQMQAISADVTQLRTLTKQSTTSIFMPPQRTAALRVEAELQRLEALAHAAPHPVPPQSKTQMLESCRNVAQYESQLTMHGVNPAVRNAVNQAIVKLEKDLMAFN